MIHQEQVLLGHLHDPESLDVLSAEGFHQAVSLAVIPTELVRKMTAWAIDYYWDNGRKVGPSREALLSVWGDRMEAMEITLGDPTEEIDSIEFAITALRSTYAVSQSQKLNREVAVAISKADPTQKVTEVIEAARRFHMLAQTLSSRRHESVLGTGIEDALLRHEDRRTNGHLMHGMTLGIDLIDQHLYGIHPGELAIFAMTTGGGKSWMAARTMLNSWRRRRRCVFVTLELDLDITFDRLACIHTGIDYDRWQRGECTDPEVVKVMDALDEIKASDCQPTVTMLRAGERDPLSIVRRAHTLGAEDLIIDQLSYVERVPGSRTRERHEQVAEELRELRALIRDDAGGMLPCLLLAQINRQGREDARAVGKYRFKDLGLSTEVENIADHLWAGFQSEDQEALQHATWQTMKFRRGVRKHWDMRWRLGVGDIRALSEVEL